MLENDNPVARGNNPEDVEAQDADTDSAPKQKAERSLADKVEDTIRALLNFVRSYIHTLWFALSPKRLQTYDSRLHSADKLLIRPLTFLSCSFVPSAVILDLSSDTVWDFLLDPETAASKIVDRIQHISPLQIAVAALPALIAIYLGSSLLSRLAVRQPDKRDIFVSGMCYAFGVLFFSTALLTPMIMLGHTRISRQLIPPSVLRALNIVLNGWVFYLILIAAALYPFAVCVGMLKEFSSTGRRWGRALASVVGVTLIMALTYWLGVLPSRFRAATLHEEKVTVDLIGDKLEIVTGPPPAVDLRMRITNPTQKLLLLPRDGLTVRLKLSSDGTVLPRNSFSVELLSVHDAPFVVLHANDATWIDGRIHPNFNDWKLLANNQAKGGAVALEPSLRDLDGTKISGAWRDASLEGQLPVGHTGVIPGP